MIEVKNLSRYYGDFAAVKDVSFTLRSGEIVGLLGHNGAGKTTIMKMLTGYLEASGGEISIDGQPLDSNQLSLRKNMGYLPESSPLYPEMIVADYLHYVAQLRGLSAQEQMKAVKKAIEQTDLAEKALEPISTLSRGYKQRVGVAQAILGKPKILILDEPTNGLDPSQIHHMRELIQSLGQSSLVLLSTHILQEVNAICDRVLVIKHGQLALDTNMQDLQHSNSIILDTNKAAAAFTESLKALKHVKLQSSQETPQGWQHTFQITDSEVSGHIATADIARTAVGVGALIYAISPDTRDLETVFAQINQSEEVPHAA